MWRESASRKEKLSLLWYSLCVASEYLPNERTTAEWVLSPFLLKHSSYFQFIWWKTLGSSVSFQRGIKANRLMFQNCTLPVNMYSSLGEKGRWKEYVIRRWCWFEMAQSILINQQQEAIQPESRAKTEFWVLATGRLWWKPLSYAHRGSTEMDPLRL